MIDGLTFGIELAVGLSCLALVVPSWRRRGGFRWLSGALAAAGLAAVVHAVPRLV